MSDDRLDRDLKSLFRRVRGEDERSAPAFAAMVARASARRAEHAAGRPALRWAPVAGFAAVAAALLLSLGIHSHRARRAAADLESWESLTQWTASTDSLLEWSGPRLEGTTIATPSDRWVGGAQGSSAFESKEKEAL